MPLQQMLRFFSDKGKNKKDLIRTKIGNRKTFWYNVFINIQLKRRETKRKSNSA